MRRYDDPVEVRKGADEDPDQFLWRGRLWQVREVVAHWVETGAWWTRTQWQRREQRRGRGRRGPAPRARGVAGGSSQGKGRCPPVARARPRLRGLRPGLQLVRGQLAAGPGVD